MENGAHLIRKGPLLQDAYMTDLCTMTKRFFVGAGLPANGPIHGEHHCSQASPFYAL
jgi:hypothetical protein